MNLWSRLGINATNDILEIKKAYALKLKDHHPEEDPEGFAELHEAYKEALKIAKNIKDNTANFVSQSEPPLNLDSKANNFNQFDIEDLPADEVVPKTSIFDKFEAVYSDVLKRIELENWKELFTGLTIDEQLEFCRDAGHFFNWHYHLPKKVWEYIDHQIDLGKSKEFRFHDLLLNRYYLDFDFIKKMPPFAYDVFFEHRLNAIRAFYSNHFDEAAEQIEKANKFYDNDPMLLAIQSGCAYHQNNMESTIKYANRALEIYPKVECALIMRSKAYIRLKKLRQAQKDCETAYALNPKSGEVKQLTEIIDLHIAENKKDKKQAIILYLRCSAPILVLLTIFIISNISQWSQPNTTDSVSNTSQPSASQTQYSQNKSVADATDSALNTSQPAQTETINDQNKVFNTFAIASKIVVTKDYSNKIDIQVLTNRTTDQSVKFNNTLNFFRKVLYSNSKYESSGNTTETELYTFDFYSGSDYLSSFSLFKVSNGGYYLSSPIDQFMVDQFMVTKQDYNKFLSSQLSTNESLIDYGG